MTAPRYIELHLNDEVPRLGSGRRRAVVRSLGPKWVSLHSAASGVTARISRQLFDRTNPRVLEPGRDFSPTKLKRRLRNAGGRP
jgi:hypothetical protein